MPELKMYSADVFKTVRVVGVRFDPCFRDTFADSCRRQIRLTWQPIISYHDKWVGLDTALHSFYDLTDSEWDSALYELDSLRNPYISLTKGKPLQPHPALVKEGLSGRFAHGLKQIVEKYAGGKKAYRVTYMNVIGEFHANGNPTTVWDFRMSELDSQGEYYFKTNPLVVDSGVFGEKSFESIGNNSEDGKEFDAHFSNGFTLATLKSGVENLLALFKDSVIYRQQVKKSEMIGVYKSALRIQQPTFHQASTTDCVSCHLSTAAQSWFERNLSPSQIAQAREPFKALWARTQFDLTNVSADYGSTRSVRALGYMGSVPAISNRVIYESANVADVLNGNHN